MAVGVRVELRDIEIFLALADELHFGRTAKRLHVSQARVSQAIKAQERRIGAALFARTSRAVSLTPVGQQLRDDLRAGYDTIQKGLAAASESARGVSDTLRLGVMGAVGYEIRDVIDLFRVHHPGGEVVLREIHFSDPFAALRAGEIDLALLWRPVREPDLVEGPVVLTEGRVLAMGIGHELAGRDSVSLEDFGDRVFFDAGSNLPDYWFEAMLPARTPSGRPILRGPRAATLHEVLTQVAADKCLTPLNEHVLRYYSHPGVVFVPVHDAPVTEWVLVWPKDQAPATVQGFVERAARLGPRAFGQPR